MTNCLQQEIIKKEEYDIYSMLIDQNFGSGQDYLLTVEDQTWGFSDNYESWALLIRRLKQEKCNVKSDTLNNYFNLNKSRYYLKSHFTTATSVLLLHDEMDKIHNDYQRGADLDFGHSGRIAKRVDKAIQYRSRYFYKVDVSTRP